MTRTVCFVSSSHPSTDKRVHYKEALALVAAGYEVVHVVREPDAPPERDGVRLVPFEGGSTLWNRLTQVFRLYRAARAVPADAYHCNEVDSWLVGLFLKWRTGAKLVYDVHEIYAAEIAESRFPKPVRPAITWLTRRIFALMTPFTDHIVLAKDSVAVDYPASSRPRQITIANYVDLGTDPGPGGREGEGGVPALLHLGEINRRRGWPQLLDAMALMDAPARLDVIGTFSDGSEAEFLARADELGLSDRVTVTGWIPYEEVAAATRTRQVGLVVFQPVMTNFTHALPHKLFDYMLAELPVIVPDFTVEVSRIVRGAECGLAVDVADPAALAAGLDRLAADPGLRRRLGSNGRKAVFETYNWEREAQRLTRFYRETVFGGHDGS